MSYQSRMNIKRTNSNDFDEKERRNLTEMSRSLRRLKRQMFLRAVEQPTTPVDGLRNLLLSVAIDENPSSLGDSKSSFGASSSSLDMNASMSSINEE